MNYFKLYEKLYSIGYHSKAKNHGQRYVEYLTGNYGFESVLDIGCSNGLTVHKMFRKMKFAYGMDVSEIAIRYAAEKSFTPNCVLGSASDIPFKDNFFDAVFSCDVLEHLEEEDVLIALSEIKRVTKKYIFIVLDCDIEGNREWIDKARVQFPREFADIYNLHLTVWPEIKWISIIESYGFKFIEKCENNLRIFEKC